MAHQSKGAHVEVRYEDLPAAFQRADSASQLAQGRYLILVRWNLSVLVVVAILTAISVTDPDSGWRQAQMVATAVLLATGLFATLIMGQRGYRQRWYGERALAESVKTSAWRYMMCAEPFTSSGDPKGVDDVFVAQLESIVRSQERTDPGSVALLVGNQITTRMRGVRQLDATARKQLYLNERILNQRVWYAAKSTWNKRRSAWLLTAAELIEFSAFLLAIAMIVVPTLPISVLGVMTTAAAALLAWLQVKRHEDLSAAYQVAADELGLVESKAEHVDTDDALSVFVADAEAAVSREHTLWLARQDTLRGVGAIADLQKSGARPSSG